MVNSFLYTKSSYPVLGEKFHSNSWCNSALLDWIAFAVASKKEKSSDLRS